MIDNFQIFIMTILQIPTCYYLLVLLGVHEVHSMMYMTEINDKTGLLDPNRFNKPPMIFQEAFEFCTTKECPGFGCIDTHDANKTNCYVMTKNWRTASKEKLTNCQNCKFYKMPLTCSSSPCAQFETCYNTEFVNDVNGSMIQYKCCPEFHCGPNCKLVNYASSMNYRLDTASFNYIDVNFPLFEDRINMCKRRCDGLNKCKSIIYERLIKPAGTTYKCYFTEFTHSNKALVFSSNPTKRLYHYYYRTKFCK